jgi:hypothetical protein
MSKMLKRYQNKLRAKLNEAAVAKRADVFVSLTTKGFPAAAAKWPDQFARMVEDVRLEFEISDKDLEEAFERAGIQPARIHQVGNTPQRFSRLSRSAPGSPGSRSQTAEAIHAWFA